jgi:hypothetical protein
MCLSALSALRSSTAQQTTTQTATYSKPVLFWRLVKAEDSAFLHLPLTRVQDEAPLLTPNVLICSVGTEIFYRTADGTLQPDQAWEAYLDQGWDKAAVQALVGNIPQLAPQVGLCSVEFPVLITNQLEV